MLFDSEQHKETSRFFRSYDFGWIESIELARRSIKAHEDLKSDFNIKRINKEFNDNMKRDPNYFINMVKNDLMYMNDVFKVYLNSADFRR